MFDNIASLVFVKGPNGEMLATGMKSAEGEIMEFRTNVAAEGRVEDWMTSVLGEMRTTNRLITKEAIFFYSHEKSRWGHTHCCTFMFVLVCMHACVCVCVCVCVGGGGIGASCMCACVRF